MLCVSVVPVSCWFCGGKKRENILLILFSDPENIIILGVAQVGNMVDINQALPQPEAAFYVSAFVVV